MTGLHNYRVKFASSCSHLFCWLFPQSFNWWREGFAKGVVRLGRDFVEVLTTVTNSAATGSMHSMEHVMLNSQQV
ncbi:hypothetical protein RJ641_032364 [Dillenia turbinata]|uniref:Uncharacterized protein n=1 Tax=Dillenia turbinata TaxID=194707 RepID=A0AAN8VZD0_9MAGN